MLDLLPVYFVPGADFPSWSPWVFGLIGIATVIVLIYQAVHYFRSHRDD